jgi:hypothetical protein
LYAKPQSIKNVEIPVQVLGEVSGMVYQKKMNMISAGG